MKPKRTNLLLTAAITFAFSGSLSAAEIAYKTTALSTAEATTAGNWVGGVAPGSGDVAAWLTDGDPVTAGNQESRGGAITIGSAVNWLGFKHIDSSGGITLSGSAITLGASGYVGSQWETLTVGNNIVLGANQPWSLNTQAATFNGVVSGGFSITKSGAGLLTLGGANTYSGGTTLAGGSLAINNTTGLGTGTLNITSTTGVTVTVANNNATTVANAITLPAPGTAQTYSVVKNTASTSTGTELTLSGNITGGNANTTLLLNSGTAGDFTTTYKLTGANTFTGTVNINRGSLVVTAASNLGASTNPLVLNTNDNASLGALRFTAPVTLTNPITVSTAATISTGSNNVTLAGAIGGTTGLTKIGSGTLTYTANNTNTGSTTVTAGTLQLDYTTNDGTKLADGLPLTLAGGTLDLAGTNVTPHLELVGSTVVSANSSLTRSGATANRIALGAITSSGGSLNIAANSLATTTNTLTNGLLPSFITVGGAPATTNGSSEIIAATGLVNVDRLGGQITSSAGSNVQIIEAGTSGNVTMASSGVTDIATLTNNGTVASTLVDIGSGNTLRLAAAGTVAAGTNGLALSNGTLTAGGADDTAGSVDVFNASANAATIGSVIADNGAGSASLIKSGGGVLVLGGTNTYTGNTTVNAGTLALASGSAIHDAASVVMGTSAGATLRLDSNETIGSISGGGASGGGVNLQSNVLTIGSSTSTYSGVISGTGNLVKTGGGVTTIQATAAQTYSGTTTVSGGATLVLDNNNSGLNSAYSSSGYLINGASTLTFKSTTGGGTRNDINSKTITFDSTGGGTVSNQAGNWVMSNCTITSNGGAVNTFSGNDINLNNGTTVIDTAVRGTGAVDLDFVKALGNSTNAAAVTKNGVGILRISAAATYTGGTIINAGTWLANVATSAFGSGSAVTLKNTATADIGGFSQTFGSLSDGGTAGGILTNNGAAATVTVGNASNTTFAGIIQNGSGTLALTKQGAGILTLSGANTYSGATNLSAGTLNLTGSAANSALTLATGTTLKGEGSSASLTTSGTSNLVINPATEPAAFTTGALTLGGVMTVSFEGGAPPSSGSVRVMNYTGTDPLTANFALASSSSYRNPQFTATGGQVNLSLGNTSLTWTAVGGSAWDVGSPSAGTTNWNDTTPAASKFYFGDAVTFNDTPGSNQTVTMAVDVQPSSITFNNSAYSYALTATTGKIIGATGITKTGTNSVTLGGANGQNYTGAIAVNDGTLKMGSRDAFGLTSGITIASGAAVDINGQTPGSVATGGYTYTIAGTGVGGTGAITHTSATYSGTNAGIKNLILADNASVGGNNERFDIGSANTAGTGGITGNGKTLTKIGTNLMGFHGNSSASPINIVVSGGTAWAEADNAVGGVNGTVTVNSTAKFGSYGVRTIATPVTLNTGATLHNQGGGIGTWTGALTLGGDSTINSTNNNIVVAGAVSGTSALTIAGPNTVILTNSNTGYTGKSVVDTGIVRIAQDTSLGAVPGALVADAITLTNGGRIQTGDATVGLNLTINPNRGITLGAGGGGFHTWGGFTTTYNGPITGSGILLKNDTGTADLGGSNDFTGGIRIDNGKLILSGTNTLGTTNGINIKGSGKTLEIASTGNVTTGAITMGDSAGGVLVVNGTLSATSFNNNWRAGDGSTNGVTINGTMTVSGNYTYSINATTVLNGSGALSVGSFTMQNATTNVLFGTGGLSFTNAGTFAMNSTNTFTQSAGTVNNTSAVVDDIRIGSGGTGTYNLNGGTYNAVNTPTTIAYANTGNFNIAAGTTANVNGFKFGRAATTNAGSLSIAGGTVNIGAGGITDGSTGANAITVTLGAATIGARADWTGTPTMALTAGATTTFNTLDSVDGTTARTITLTSPLTGGTGALTKTGAGTLSLAGVNTYTGATTIDGGKLHLGTSLASTSVTVNAAGAIQAGTVTTSGTSTVPALTMNGGSMTVRAAYTGGDKLVVSGTNGFTVPATTTVNVIPSTDLLTGDRIPFIDYNGTAISGTELARLTAVAPNPHYTVSVEAGSSSNSGEDDSMVVLVMGAANGITWYGNVSGVWNEGAGGVQNWQLADTTSTPFYNLDVVTFDDNGVETRPVVTLTGTISPASVEVKNEGGTYTFQGAPLTGTTTLTKNGGGGLTLAAANAHTGLTKLEAGTLNISHAQALGTGAFTITGGVIDNTTAGPLTLTSGNAKNLSGNFTFTGSQNLNLGTGAVTLANTPAITVAANTLTIDSIIGGTGFTKAGAGTMVLNGANNYTGTTTVNGGTLEVSANSGAKVYSVAAGATLKLGYSTGNNDYNYGITVNGSGTASTSGLYIEGGDSLVLQNTLTLATAPSTVRAYGTGTGTLRGWDVNGTHLTVQAAASGSVIDTNIALNGSGYGYRMNIASGTNTATGDLVVNGTMPGSAVAGFANFRKEGTGSVLINSAATYAAGMDIRNGSVILGGNDRLPVASYVAIGFNADSGKLVLNGYNQTLASVTAVGTGTKSVVGGSSTASILTVNNASDVTYSGKLGGAGTNENNLALVKSGAGILTLSGANTHYGNTTVNAGKLTLGTTGQLGFKLGNSGATNLVSGAGEAEFNGVFNIDTTAVTDTTGTWVLANVTTQSFTSTFSVSGFVDPEEDGIWIKPDTGGKTWTFSESAGTLTLETAGYDSWASGYGLTGNDALRGSDPDGDGFTNLQEFLFGTNPTTNTGSLTTTEQSGGILTIRWNQRTSGATYLLKESATLANDWTTWGGTPATDGAVSGDYQPMKADVTIGAGKDFFRVEGVEN